VARRLLYVAFFFEVGLLLVVLPWSAFWDSNYFVRAWPSLRQVLADDFVRGGVSGLGVLNVLAGLSELSPVFSARARRSVPLGDEGAADSHQ
jgi:hypothetical protein